MTTELLPTDSPPRDRFHPRDGAVLDLACLQAVAAAPDALLDAWLRATVGAGPGLVLEGLELQGQLATSGPPGSVRPDPRAPGVVVAPGRVVLRDADAQPLLIDVPEPLRAPWPTEAGPAVRGRLVLVPRRIEARTMGGVQVAREAVGVRLGFLRQDQVLGPGALSLAMSVGNGQDWATDLHRLWQPEHPALDHLLTQLQRLEVTVWTAEPEGAVWDRQVLGRNWVRYQTVAASALQATRLALLARPTTTRERVRLLRGLYQQLRRSVERGATELIQLAGPAEGAGPYRDLDNALLGSWS